MFPAASPLMISVLVPPSCVASNRPFTCKISFYLFSLATPSIVPGSNEKSMLLFIRRLHGAKMSSSPFAWMILFWKAMLIGPHAFNTGTLATSPTGRTRLPTKRPLLRSCATSKQIPLNNEMIVSQDLHTHAKQYYRKVTLPPRTLRSLGPHFYLLY